MYNDDASYDYYYESPSDLSELAFTAEADTAYYVFLLASSYDGTCGKVDIFFSADFPGGFAHQPSSSCARLHPIKHVVIETCLPNHSCYSFPPTVIHFGAQVRRLSLLMSSSSVFIRMLLNNDAFTEVLFNFYPVFHLGQVSALCHAFLNSRHCVCVCVCVSYL